MRSRFHTSFFGSLLSVLALFAAGGHAQSTVATHYGSSVGNDFGQAVALIGDFNNDGFDDFAAGAPNDDSVAIDAGRVSVYSGNNGTLLIGKLGDAATDGFGYSITGLGDINNDGFDDFAVGAPFASPNGSKSGKVKIISGNTGAVLTTINGTSAGDQFGFSIANGGKVAGVSRIVIGAPFRNGAGIDQGSVYLYTTAGALLHEYLGTQAGENYGWSVSGGFDISGDAIPDVLGGSRNYNNGANTGAGRIMMRSGAAPWGTNYTLFGPAFGAHFGTSVAFFGDITNDGKSEFVVGAPDYLTKRGGTFVYNGVTAALLNTYLGNALGDTFGFSVAAAGDYDGDGNNDFVAGAPESSSNATNAGYVRIHHGATSSTIAHTAPNLRAGYSVAGGGDFNNDSRSEIIYGLPTLSNLANHYGKVKSYSVSSMTDYTIDGFVTGDQAGASVRILGDVDGDGTADYVIGAPYAAHSYFSGMTGIVDEYAGRVEVRSGATNSVIYTLHGNEGDNFGHSVASAGDMNLDGRADFIVGAPMMNTILPNEGYATVYSGLTGNLMWTIASVVNNEAFGFAVDGAGDLNDDGYPDYIIGAPKSSQYGLNAGYAITYSGKTGFLLWIAQNSTVSDQYGYSVAGLKTDMNGDGKDDVIVGIPFNDTNGANAGRALVLSGANGNVLFTLNGDAAGDNFGASVATAGDVNVDGKVDGLIGAPFRDNFFATDGGICKVMNGANATILQSYFGLTNNWQLGNSVAPVGDIDNDGRADYAAGGTQMLFIIPTGPGIVEVISGKTNSRIYNISQGDIGDRFGASVGGFADMNNDSYPEIIVGAPWTDSVTSLGGAAYLISLHPNGVSFYGTGTPGCDGSQYLTTEGTPYIGNTSFGFRSDRAPANSLGALLVTDSQDFTGSDVFGIGVTLHVDFLFAIETFSYDMFSDALGYGSVTTALPNDPVLVGNIYYGQVLWVETDCIQPGFSPYNLSASEA
ncbi:MAG: hypothetical protein ACKVS6_15865, partial [Planctomycetota bacterium]